MIFWLIVLLLFFGIILILLEVIVPHGLSILAGVAVIAVSCYLCYASFGVRLGTIYLVFSIVLAVAAAYVVFRSSIRFMALHPLDDKAGRGTAAGAADQEPQLGEWLSVIQPLRPTGTVQWRGRRLPARSLRPEVEIPVGARVRLMERDSVYLLVEAGDGDVKNMKIL